MTQTEQTNDGAIGARRRLIIFGLHLVGYFIVIVAFFLVTSWQGGDPTKWVIAMVGWGSALAIHAAFVMGLFEVFSRHGD